MLECLIALASPLFVKIRLVETNALPLASDSSTFWHTGIVCQNWTSLTFARLACAGIQWCSRQLVKELFHFIFSRRWHVVPCHSWLERIDAPSPRHLATVASSLSTAVTSSVPLSLVLSSLRRFQMCPTFDTSSAMNREFANHLISLRTHTSSWFNDDSIWINSHVGTRFIHQQVMDQFNAQIFEHMTRAHARSSFHPAS